MAAAETLRSIPGACVEILVVDNNSDDETAAMALDKGAIVIHELVQGISRARNTGARHTRNEVLVFIDADVIVPPGILLAIHSAMSDSACAGGGVDVDYRPKRAFIRIYLRCWRLISRAFGMVQGATQFCRRDVFEEIGGYDEMAWIGEDVDFFWALKRLARKTQGKVQLIRNPRVRESSRRFDQWPVWRSLIWANPLFIALLRRRKLAWGGWYSRPVR